MGLFDFLFPSKPPSRVTKVDDRIWLVQPAKFAGLEQELAARVASDTMAVLLLSHFPNHLPRLEELAAKYDRAGNDAGTPVRAILAESLSPEIAERFRFDESALIDLLVIERHPLRSADARLEEFAAGLPCRCRIAYHVALDDPLMRRFAGEWVEQIVRSLGMSEEEAIESAMVARRIRTAQEQVEKQAIGNYTAESSEEWFRRNMPGE